MELQCASCDLNVDAILFPTYKRPTVCVKLNAYFKHCPIINYCDIVKQIKSMTYIRIDGIIAIQRRYIYVNIVDVLRKNLI